ncbi:MAG: hypothetical protein R2754_16225 [Microthrixaceae bacterium]
MATQNGNSGDQGGPVTSHPSNQPSDLSSAGGEPAVDPHPADDLDAQVVELVLDELDGSGDEVPRGSGATLHTLVTEPRQESDVYDYDEEAEPGDARGEAMANGSNRSAGFGDARGGGPDSVASASSTGSVASVASAGSIASSHSVGSIASAHSAGSVASALSAGSIVSLSSVGSLASILSVGSYRSILSIGSRNSILSIGADGGLLTIGRGARSRSLLRR